MRRWLPAVFSLTLTFAAVESVAVPEGAIPPDNTASSTNEEQARLAYNIGVSVAEQADRASKAEAAKLYTEARNSFKKASMLMPEMPAAWNMLGYTERKLGNYDVALDAYNRALMLRPSYAEALEYRGEAYLGLNRLEEAKQSYLDLFGMNRALADQLLTAMKQWLTSPAAKSADRATAAEFGKWVQERERIAAQTAALTREGTRASWQ